VKSSSFLVVLVGIGLCGCTTHRPDTTSLSPSQVAKEGLLCLEHFDGKGFGDLMWDRECLKTGLNAAAVKAIVEGPYKSALSSFHPEGEPTINSMDVNQVEIERTYRSPDGRRHGIALIAAGGGDGSRLVAVSMQLFTALGNSQQKPHENHYAALRRTLKTNRRFFESVGWRGIVGNSSAGDYRDWDTLDRHFSEMELKEEALKEKLSVH